MSSDDDVETVLATMSSHQVRRLPVIDQNHVVGVIALADVARALPNRTVGDVLGAISGD